MGVDFGYGASASAVFRALADATPAYEGLRYPAMKDESNPVRARYPVHTGQDLANVIASLTARVEAMADNGEKTQVTPRIGHKLHRLTTMTSKTPQFHLLASGNPKPDSLLLSPLVQLNPDGTPRESAKAEAAAIGIRDRSNVGGR
jgi:hypothetical protein